MPQAEVWFVNNDMRVRLTGLASSTMASGTYLASSTGVTVEVWDALSTASTADKVVSATNMPYYASGGIYQKVIQSTAHSMTAGQFGMAIVKVRHSGLDGEWRTKFRVSNRGST